MPMTDALASMMQKMQEHFGQVDETVLVVLKGHLLIEESLDAIISAFVFHPEFVQAARLRFGQKLSLARAMSLDEHKNGMWDIAFNLNSLRNELAHSLHSPKRAAKIKAVLDVYFREADNAPADVRDQPEHVMLYFAIGFFLGFLTEFQAEVKRLQRFREILDPMVNPHRYLDADAKD
jgi:hypothetical protein